MGDRYNGVGIQPWIQDLVDNPPQHDDCIPWPFGGNPLRPVAKLRRKSQHVQAYLWQRVNGPKPPGYHTLANLCGDKSCCNFKHWEYMPLKMAKSDPRVFANTRTDPVEKISYGPRMNARLAMRAARLARYEVTEVVQAFQDGETVQELAERYEVSRFEVRRAIDLGGERQDFVSPAVLRSLRPAQGL